MFLTLAHLNAERVRQRFPTIAAMCRQVGIDIAVDRIPVGPAAHYLMGGVETDEWGARRCPDFSLPARRRAQASMARIGWPAIRCWRDLSSALERRKPCNSLQKAHI